MTKDDSYKPILYNQLDGKSHCQVLVHDVVVKKLTYEDKEAKGEIVNIYQKPQSLINCLLDLCSNEGDWVLDLFSGLDKFYYIKMNFTFFLFMIIYYIFSFYFMIRYNTSMLLTKGKKLHFHWKRPSTMKIYLAKNQWSSISSICNARIWFEKRGF